MSAEIPTPRTDSVSVTRASNLILSSDELVFAEFARGLERELIEIEKKSTERKRVLNAYEAAYLTLPGEYRVAFSAASCDAYRTEEDSLNIGLLSAARLAREALIDVTECDEDCTCDARMAISALDKVLK